MQQAPWRPQQQIYIKKKKKAFRSLRMKSKYNVISNNKQGHNNNIKNSNNYNNKNARRPKESHISQNLKEIRILDRSGEDLKKLVEH